MELSDLLENLKKAQRALLEYQRAHPEEAKAQDVDLEEVETPPPSIPIIYLPNPNPILPPLYQNQLDAQQQQDLIRYNEKHNEELKVSNANPWNPKDRSDYLKKVYDLKRDNRKSLDKHIIYTQRELQQNYQLIRQQFRPFHTTDSNEAVDVSGNGYEYRIFWDYTNNDLENLALNMAQASTVYPNTSNRYTFKVRFYKKGTTDRQTDLIWRTLQASSLAEVITKLRMFVGDLEDIKYGSDVVEAEYAIDLTYFQIKIYTNIEDPTVIVSCKTSNKRRPDLDDHEQGFKVYDIGCDAGNCLLACLKRATKDGRQYKTYRKLINIEAPTPIPIALIPQLSDIFKTNIIVYKRINDVTTLYSKTDTNHTHTTELILSDDNDHVSLIDRSNVPKFSKSKREKIPQLILYDFKYIFDRYNKNQLRTYALTTLTFPRDDNNIDFTKLKPITFYGDDLDQVQHKFISSLKGDKTGNTYQLISYRNAMNTNYILAKAAVNREFLKDIVYVKSQLYTLRLGRHTVFDLHKVIPSDSLIKATKNFQTTPQIIPFDYTLPQRYFDQFGEQKFLEWVNTNKSIIEEHSTSQLLAMADMLHKLRKTIKMLDHDSETPLDFLSLKVPTIAAIAYELLSRKVDWYSLSAAISEEVDQFYRTSLVGPACINFNFMSTIIKEQTYYFIDCNALYPTVMIGKNKELFPKEYQYGRYPTSEGVPTTEFNLDKLGIYCVKILSHPRKQVIPYRKDNGELDYNYHYPFETFATSADLWVHLKHGGTFDTIYGYYFPDDRDDLFVNFLTPLIHLKETSTTPAIVQTSKIIMNGTYGKTLQQNYTEVSKLTTKIKDYNMFRQELDPDKDIQDIHLSASTVIVSGSKVREAVYDYNKARPSQLGVFILSYGRMLMYELITSKYNILYQDCDSALLPEKDYLEFIKEYPNIIGNKTGQFKIQTSGLCDIYITQRKMYYVKNLTNPDTSIVRIKGVNIETDEFELNKEDFVPIKPNIDVFFKQLHKNNKINVRCVQTFRDIHNLTVKREFVIKEIKVDGDLE